MAVLEIPEVYLQVSLLSTFIIQFILLERGAGKATGKASVLTYFVISSIVAWGVFFLVLSSMPDIWPVLGEVVNG